MGSGEGQRPSPAYRIVARLEHAPLSAHHHVKWRQAKAPSGFQAPGEVGEATPGSIAPPLQLVFAPAKGHTALIAR